MGLLGGEDDLPGVRVAVVGELVAVDRGEAVAEEHTGGVVAAGVDPHLLQYSTVQYSTVQYSTVQYSTVQYSTVQ